MRNIRRKFVYTVTAYYADPLASELWNPVEEFVTDTREQAEQMKNQLLQDPDYSRVEVSDFPEEMEVF